MPNRPRELYGVIPIWGLPHVETGNLNVREQPSTDSKLVGKLPKNAACESLAQRENGPTFSQERWKAM